MLKNNIYSTNSLETLLLQSSSTALNTISSSSVSYDTILQSMKETLERKTALEKADNEVSELEAKFDKELQQLRTETAIYDMFHNAYITNGLFNNTSKSKLRTQKYSMWNSIFSMQAERFKAQTQIAIQTALSRQIKY